MAVIAFSAERAWVKAAWAVERVLADMLAASPNDPRVREVLQRAVDVNSLSLDFIEEPTSSRLKEILEVVIKATIQESPSLHLKWKEGLNENAQAQYKQAVQELGDLARQ